MPAHASDALDAAMRDALPHLFEAAPDLLYQLVTMLSPSQLQQRNVPVHRLVHHEGSFVITFPNAYHSGFNTGKVPPLLWYMVFCAACYQVGRSPPFPSPMPQTRPWLGGANCGDGLAFGVLLAL